MAWKHDKHTTKKVAKFRALGVGVSLAGIIGAFYFNSHAAFYSSCLVGIIASGIAFKSGIEVIRISKPELNKY